MEYELFLSQEAEKDIEQAAIWYEERRNGLGREYLLCIQAMLSTIQRNPQLFSILYRNVRRALIRRFPYGIFFFIDDERRRIVVVGVLHARRSPHIWQERKE